MYHVSRNGSSEGPFDAATIETMIADGSLKHDDSLWQEGWDGWREVSTQFPPTSSGRPSVIAPPPLPADQPASTASGPQPIFTMKGPGELLEVFSDKVAITPKGALGFMVKGMKGTKFIPFYSITAIQFKKAGAVFSGYLQFTIPGGVESRRGGFAAASDENTFMFGGVSNNPKAQEIKDYIDKEIAKLRNPSVSVAQPLSVADELMKLAELRSKGILSDEEFAAAKASLLKG